jgi:hypothetical protein
VHSQKRNRRVQGSYCCNAEGVFMNSAAHNLLLKSRLVSGLRI